MGAAALCRRQEGRSDLRSRCGAPSWSAPAIHLKQTYEGSEDEDNDDIVNEVNKGLISIDVVWPAGQKTPIILNNQKFILIYSSNKAIEFSIHMGTCIEVTIDNYSDCQGASVHGSLYVR